MLNKDSFFNKIPLNLDYKNLLLIEGIKYSFINIETTYKRLIDNLVEISTLKGKQENLFLDIWSLIDNISRLIKMINKLNGNKKSIQEYINKVKIINNFRNTFQHLDERITKDGLEKFILPLYGEVKWIYIYNSSKSLIFNCFAGPLKNGMETKIINPIGKKIFFDKHIGELLFISTIKKGKKLTIKELNIIEVYKDIKEIYNILNIELEKNFKSSIKKFGIHGQDCLLNFEIKH